MSKFLAVAVCLLFGVFQTAQAEYRVSVDYRSSLDRLAPKVIAQQTQGERLANVASAAGNPQSVTDPSVRTTRYTYDSQNRLRETILPDDTPADPEDNPRSTNEYDLAGRLIATVDPLGQRTEYEYDTLNRRTVTRDHLGHETRYEYDWRGRKRFVEDANHHRTEFVYDDAGQLIETLYPDGATTSATYDKIGRKISQTDQNGHTTQYEYDAAGRLTAVIDAHDQRTEYEYDQQGNQLVQRDALDRETRWDYDHNGRRTARTLPLEQTEYFEYDDNGNRTRHIDFNGDETLYHYDAMNREYLREYLADGQSVATTYTADGQLYTQTDAAGATVRDYDTQGHLAAIDYPDGQRITYTNNARGQVLRLESGGHVISYQYDVLGRLQFVIDGSATTEYGYDNVGNRAIVQYPNGLATSYGHDALNRLIEQTTADAAGNELARLDYTLDDAGHRLQLDEATGRSTQWVYDELYRLTEEHITDPQNGDRSTVWGYDAVGNRLTQTVSRTGIEDGLTSYQYDDNDRLQGHSGPEGSVTYDYDDNGNTLTKIDSWGTTDYRYNQANRLIEATTPEATLAYAYHPDGIRRQKTENGQATHYLIDPNRPYAQVLGEYDTAQNELAFYTYGDDLLAQSRGGQTRYYHYDGLGTTRALSDDTGFVTDTYAYEAFGEPTGSEGSTENNYLFTGEQFDPGSGLYYLRARYMEPGVGRLVTQDQFKGQVCEPLSLHDYIYAHANPIHNVDPSGLTPLMELMTGVNLGGYQRQSQAVAAHRNYKRVKTSLCRVGAVGLENGHHMIPVFMGGLKPKDSGNIIYIDAKYHNQFHQLLHYMLRFNGLLGGNVAAAKWDSLFNSVIDSRKAAYTVLIQAAKIFDDACKLKSPFAIAPVIKKQIKEGKWEF